jgi:hypothetical protein
MDSYRGKTIMNPERRLEILEAFICTKPREFDAFVIAYNEAHPVNEAPIVESLVAVEEAPKVTRKRKTTASEEESV